MADDWDGLKNKGGRFFLRPTLGGSSGGASLASACDGGHHAGGDCGQGIGGWLGDADGLEGEGIKVG